MKDAARFKFNPLKTSKKELIEHAFAFERAAYELLQRFRAEQAKSKPEGEQACEPEDREGVANARKADAGCLMATTKAWDTALERLRVLKGSPLPGSRRPTDPPPKVKPPKNKPPT